MISEGWASLLSRFADRVSSYHDHRVIGIENVPVSGPALLVLHHSLATYDGLLLAVAIWHRTGRAPAGLGHDRLFDLPGLSGLVERMGIRRASPENGRALLRAGELVGVAPGGMREALRPSRERYQVRWSARRGFARLALTEQVPMVLAACPRADELFDVQDHPLTHWAYESFRWPLPVVRGRRGLPVPRRVPLVHYIAPPIYPPDLDAKAIDAQIDGLHEEATRVMTGLLARR